jgi:hypothetical protein
MIMKAKPKFSPGQLLSTPGALEALNEAQQSPMDFLGRHVYGDWGDVCEEDQQTNEEALEHGLRLLSSYRTTEGVKLWVITEADRSATTILLPEEY